MTYEVTKTDDGKVVEVRTDKPILDPESPDAVQVTVDATNDNPLSHAEELSPNEVAELDAEPSEEVPALPDFQ